MRRVIPTLLALAATSAWADGLDAKQLYYMGQTAFDAGDYNRAIADWESSYRLSPKPALLFNLGQAYRLRAGTGDCRVAAERFGEFLAQDPTSTQRAVAEQFEAETRRCAEPAPTPAPMPPPPPPPPAPPHTGSTGAMRIAGIATLGVGVGLLGLAIYEGAEASRLGKDITSTCATGCVWQQVVDDDRHGRSAQRWQWILGGAGAAAIVGGAVVYWLGRDGAGLAVAPAGRDGAVATWSGTW